MLYHLFWLHAVYACTKDLLYTDRLALQVATATKYLSDALKLLNG